MARWLAYLLPGPVASSSIPIVPPKKFIGKKLLMLVRLIKGTAYRRVDSGLKMFI